MSKEWMEKNGVCVAGKIASGFTYSHEMFGERFYKGNVLVSRNSGVIDTIPLMISERLMEMDTDKVYSQGFPGRIVEMVGQLRSYNKHEEKMRRLELFVFVQGIRFLEKEVTDYGGNNMICLEGYLCRQPVYRRTPKGIRITEILLAVNRAYGKSDYIPCIAWGENAALASGFAVGTRIKISGRMQSREYIKKLSETESEVRVAYEVSICRLEADFG